MFVEIYFVFCALSCLQLSNGAATKTNDSTIVLPGPTFNVTRRQETEDVPEECKNQNYCTVKPDDYPQELFDDLFKGKFKEPVYQPYVMTENRFGDPDLMNDCDTRVSYEPIFRVKTDDGKWHTVVQAPTVNYLQMLRLETCVNERGSCFLEFKMLPGMKTACSQEYTQWEFLVLADEGGTEKVQVKLPTCCKCRYMSTE